MLRIFTPSLPARILACALMILMAAPSFGGPVDNSETKASICEGMIDQALNMTRGTSFVRDGMDKEILTAARHRVLDSIQNLTLGTKAKLNADFSAVIERVSTQPEIYEKAARILRSRVKGAVNESPSLWPEVAFFFSLNTPNPDHKLAILDAAQRVEIASKSLDTDRMPLDISLLIAKLQTQLDAHVLLMSQDSSVMRILATLIALNEEVPALSADRIHERVALITLVDQNPNGEAVTYDRMTSHLSISLSADPLKMTELLWSALRTKINNTEIASQVEIMIRQIKRDYGIQIFPIGNSPDSPIKTKHLTAENFAAIGGLWHHKEALPKLAAAGVRKLYLSPQESWFKAEGIQNGKLKLTFSQAFRIEKVLKADLPKVP